MTAPAPAPAAAAAPTADERFAFDNLGYLHLRGAIAPDELAEIIGWCDAARAISPQALNADRPDALRHQLNRPLSRVLDAEPRLLRCLDHPAVRPYLAAFLGEDHRHIDNDLYDTAPGFAGGGWHRGVHAHATGYVIDGAFRCPMVKVFWCLTDVCPGQGEFVVVPGSHKSRFAVDEKRLDLPGQHRFDDVRAGDLILFNEALLHNGRPNTTARWRRTLIINYGSADARCWAGYAPLPATLARATPRQRAILTNEPGEWSMPEIAGQLR